jgi:hypothetical protein
MRLTSSSYVRTNTSAGALTQRLKIRSIEDIQKAPQPPRCGTTGTGATGHYFPKFIEESLGAKIQIVLGYPGNRDAEVAIERGEVHCYAITKEAFLREPGRSWLKKGFVEC